MSHECGGLQKLEKARKWIPPSSLQEARARGEPRACVHTYTLPLHAAHTPPAPGSLPASEAPAGSLWEQSAPSSPHLLSPTQGPTPRLRCEGPSNGTSFRDGSPASQTCFARCRLAPLHFQ